MFPLYRDKRTVKKMILDCQKVLKKSKIKKNEIVIVDDGCPEASGYYAKKISKKVKILKSSFIKKIWVTVQQ